MYIIYMLGRRLHYWIINFLSNTCLVRTDRIRVELFFFLNFKRYNAVTDNAMTTKYTVIYSDSGYLYVDIFQYTRKKFYTHIQNKYFCKITSCCCNHCRKEASSEIAGRYLLRGWVPSRSLNFVILHKTLSSTTIKWKFTG